ncbi:MerR family transcriptional regulator [Candidatus Nomurabacteria bacterium]|nr:MerR family transcriptional regulator [Candidatus Nomurabacteria bacterium]
MTSGQLIKKSAITRDTLRHYNRLGLIQPGINPQNGYKIYTSADIKQIKFIKSIQQIGFSLSEIKELISRLERAKCKHQSIIPDLQRHLESVNEKIRVLNETRDYLEELIKDFKNTNCEVRPKTFKLPSSEK